ncbi:lysophospholipase [Litorimonas sp. RW-G-Af-16]|uniref:alpha/beta hydrolase n=1 Tax=Litorimonas sp. RW-G-Af-16 TaxID=3241168 RepID=UPI00390CD37F
MDDGVVFTLARPDGAKRFGRVWEAKNPKAVLSLIHGFGEHSGRYHVMAEFLNAHGISVVALDLTGHGRNDGPRGVTRGFDDFRDDLAALLDKTHTLFPDLPHILFGHSMGGGIVLDHSFNPAPDLRAIIASAPLIKPADKVPGALRALAKVMGVLVPKGGMAQPLDATKISTLKAEQALYANDPLNHGRIGFRTATGIIENGEAVARRAPDWTMPLLLLHARDDRLTDFAASEAFAMLAKNVTFEPYEHVEHEIHNDVTRARVHKTLATFILSHATPNV